MRLSRGMGGRVRLTAVAFQRRISQGSRPSAPLPPAPGVRLRGHLDIEGGCLAIISHVGGLPLPPLPTQQHHEIRRPSKHFASTLEAPSNL